MEDGDRFVAVCHSMTPAKVGNASRATPEIEFGIDRRRQMSCRGRYTHLTGSPVKNEGSGGSRSWVGVDGILARFLRPTPSSSAICKISQAPQPFRVSSDLHQVRRRYALELFQRKYLVIHDIGRITLGL